METRIKPSCLTTKTNEKYQAPSLQLQTIPLRFVVSMSSAALRDDFKAVNTPETLQVPPVEWCADGSSPQDEMPCVEEPRRSRNCGSSRFDRRRYGCRRSITSLFHDPFRVL
jgi:hypothetical protein